MLIELLLTRDASRKWHEALRRRLTLLGHAVRVSSVGAARPSPAGLELLLAFERLVYGASRTNNFSEPFVMEPSGGEFGDADLCIDLTAAPNETARARRLIPIWNDQMCEFGAVSAIVEKRPPRLAVVLRESDADTYHLVAEGVPSLEEPDIFNRSFDRVCGRMCDLVVQAVERMARADAHGVTGELRAAPVAFRPTAAANFALGGLLHKISARLTALAKQGPQWRMGWRRTADDAVIETLRWPAAGYEIFKDDGKRYFADPFVFAHAGATHVFCEEFPFATQRGILSVFDISADGAVSAARPVLEAPYHLSYPMVFAHGEDVFMIPESSGNGTVDLWRAERFPDRWVHDATLLQNVVASDATIVEHGGLFWLFATLAEEGQSTWDSLAIYWADNLRGPWRAHPLNPVLIDAGCARPAGGMAAVAGRLLRPAQNCIGGYGAGLSLCEVTRLDREGYAQSVIASLAAPPALRASGVHTLNHAGGVEVIDFLA